MAMGGRWNVAAAGVSCLLGIGGCDLGSLVDDTLDDYKRMIPAAGVDQVKTTVGPKGGEARTEHGGLSVPEGAVEGDVMISVAETPVSEISAPLPGLLKPVTPPMAFTPHGTTFLKPVTLSLFFDGAQASKEMFVLRLDNEQDTSWELVDAQIEGSAAYVTTTHFSIYGVVGCDGADARLAALCTDLASGEVSLEEALDEAPPDERGWDFEEEGDGDPDATDRPTEPDTTDGQGGQGDTVVEPAPVANTDCTQLATSCKDQVVGACEEYQRLCTRDVPDQGSEQPVTSDATCEEMAVDCKAGVVLACDAYASKCNIVPAPDCWYVERCEQACSAEGVCSTKCWQEQVCGGGADEAVSCDQLQARCLNEKDEQACLEYEKCTNTEPTDPPPADGCSQALEACGADSADGCAYYQLYCADHEPTPAEMCAVALTACDTGNTDACAYHTANCTGSEPVDPPIADDCVSALEGCKAGYVDACTVYETSCSGTAPGEPPPPDAGADCWYVEQCDEYCTAEGDCYSKCWQELVCDAVEPPPPTDAGEPVLADADCEFLYSACMEDMAYCEPYATNCTP